MDILQKKIIASFKEVRILSASEKSCLLEYSFGIANSIILPLWPLANHIACLQ